MPFKLDHDEFCNYPHDCICARLGMARDHERRIIGRRLVQLKEREVGTSICVLHLTSIPSCAYCVVGKLYDAIVEFIESGRNG